MAGSDSHSKCARCRDKGLGDDPCVQKKECNICRGFTPEQTLQLSTPTYRDRKDKKVTTSSSTPTLVDPAHVRVLGKVEKVKAVQSTPTTAKKTTRSESPKPSANKKKFLPVPWMMRSTGTGQQTEMSPEMTLTVNLLRRPTTGRL